MTRDLIDDAAWALIAPLLPPERRRAFLCSIDNRWVLEGILWIARAGSPWRDLPERFSKWSTGRAQVRTMAGSLRRSWRHGCTRHRGQKHGFF
ncbi:MAG: transposase [Paracoccaceae bacterium]